MSEKINTKQKGVYEPDFELVGGSEEGEMKYKAGEISEEAKNRLKLGQRALEAARLMYGGSL